MPKKSGYTAILGNSTEYSGCLSFKGTVRIDGRYSGEINSDGKLVLGKDAFLEGIVRVGELVVHGTLKGEVIVTKRAILHSTAVVTANVVTALLVMEEGAELQGQLQMGETATKVLAEQAEAPKLNTKGLSNEETVKQ